MLHAALHSLIEIIARHSYEVHESMNMMTLKSYWDPGFVISLPMSKAVRQMQFARS